jgi:hypothetical protein
MRRVLFASDFSKGSRKAFGAGVRARILLIHGTHRRGKSRESPGTRTRISW